MAASGLTPRQRHDAGRQGGRRRRGIVGRRLVGVVSKEGGEVGRGLIGEARHQRAHAGISGDLGGIEVQLLPPHQSRRLTFIDEVLKEPLEELDAQALPDAGQAGVIGQALIEGVAQVPAVGQMQTGRRHQFALRADAFEEHDQLQLEEDHRIEAGPTALGVHLLHPLPDKAEVQGGLQVAVEVVGGHHRLQRDSNRLIEMTRLGGTEHARLRDVTRTRGAVYRAPSRRTPPFSTR